MNKITGKRLSKADAWALAAGGIWSLLNGSKLDRLEMTGGAEKARTTLGEWWEANDAAALAEMKEWLTREGHNECYTGTVKMASGMEQDLETRADMPPGKLSVAHCRPGGTLWP